MHGPDKCDPQLGAQIEKYLKKIGVQTPKVPNSYGNDEKIVKIRKHFTEIMKVMGLDLTDDSLCDTPNRVAKMYVNEIFYGLDPKNFPKCTAVDNKMKYDELVVERNINTQSNCEHHFIVIDGLTHIGYIPKNKVLGLSKLNRVVEYFAKRPQIQERLTEQVYYALQYILETDDIAVITMGKHFCVKSRGVQDVLSDTTTSKMGGRFRSDTDLRKEFLTLAVKA